MSSDNVSPEIITAARRIALAGSIRTVSYGDLKALGEGLFSPTDEPTRGSYFKFISDNCNTIMHHATTNDGIHIVYCPEKKKGVWFVPGTGFGPLQTKSLRIVKEISENS
jgi:hypothetical protein